MTNYRTPYVIIVTVRAIVSAVSESLLRIPATILCHADAQSPALHVPCSPPALPDRRPSGGDFAMVERLRPCAQAVGQALRGGGFV